MKTKTYTEMTARELEALAHKAYGLPGYSFAVVQECGNDTCHTFQASKIDTFDFDHNAEVIKNIRNGRAVAIYFNHLLLNTLCEDSHLPAGDYLIRVCW